MDRLADFCYALVDKVKGLIPDTLLRVVIRSLCRRRLQDIDAGSFETNHGSKMARIQKARDRAIIADETEKANTQHYEVSTKFILSTLGPYAKYSSCLYPTGRETLEQAELCMLESYCEKAGLEDGIDILDLGCGWGSLCIYLAQKYPNSRIIALSNSTTQKAHIDSHNYTNLRVYTGDVNYFDFPSHKGFDRILSIEMFEHMKGYDALLKKISSWLKPNAEAHGGEAMVFVQIFCHRTIPYDFIENDSWMAKTFFSGGTMPSHDLLVYFQSDLALLQSWFINGRHYARTCEDWLKLQDKNREMGLRVLEADAEARGIGKLEGRKTYFRFRTFYMACAEFFAMNGGEEWGIGHYLYKGKN